jgi:nucleoprotein TPR
MASAEVLMAGGVQLNPARLATFLSVSDEDIRSLASITEAYIASILQAVVAKANEFDELKADKLRVEVELEQSVRTADSRVKSMKGQLDLALAETQELRIKASRIGSSSSPALLPISRVVGG